MAVPKNAWPALAPVSSIHLLSFEHCPTALEINPDRALPIKTAWPTANSAHVASLHWRALTGAALVDRLVAQAHQDLRH